MLFDCPSEVIVVIGCDDVKVEGELKGSTQIAIIKAVGHRIPLLGSCDFVSMSLL